MDTFLRSYMDVEGYVPLAIVCNYQNIACYGIAIADIMNKFEQIGSSRLEIDPINETIKLKEKWEMVSSTQVYGRSLFTVHDYLNSQTVAFVCVLSRKPCATLMRFNSSAYSG